MAASSDGYEQILFERVGRVGLITLNRPEKLNAWTPQMEAEFIDAVNRSAADRGISALVVTGAGRAFCAGADIGGWAQDLATRGERPPDSPLLAPGRGAAGAPPPPGGGAG